MLRCARLLLFHVLSECTLHNTVGGFIYWLDYLLINLQSWCALLEANIWRVACPMHWCIQVVILRFLQNNQISIQYNHTLHVSLGERVYVTEQNEMYEEKASEFGAHKRIVRRKFMIKYVRYAGDGSSSSSGGDGGDCGSSEQMFPKFIQTFLPLF